MATFSPDFLEELRARTPLPGLIGRRVKLSRAGRQWKGCCPFHGEKTPSFYVYDDHFHCFGCGVHGDAVSFVMQSEGASFPEAVERLAGEAGLELPRRDAPADREAVSRGQRLLAVLEDAAGLFRRFLREAPDAGRARDYLAGRGVGAGVVETFGLGWSGDGTRLRPALAALGHAPDAMAGAGLLLEGEDGGIRGEMFRARLMFPIADRRGRVVGFGGRTLGDGQPRYLNGPETAVFAKRRLLYGHHHAHAALHAPGRSPRERRRALVVAEGYMDVIALHEAGIPAVAPLGTALTEEQLELAWRLDPAPVLCLDGDEAGRRAALRGAERALPLLTAERTLRIAELAPGEDPDSLLRRQGQAALAAFVDAARPLSEALYDLLAPPAPSSAPSPGGRPAAATPEARAAFRARLLEAVGRIADKGLAGEYRRAFLDRFFADGRTRQNAPPPRRQPRPALSDPASREERAAMLAVIALHHPDLVHDIEGAWMRVALEGWLAELRDAILHLPADVAATGATTDAGAPLPLDLAASVTHLTASGFGDHLSRARELVGRKGALHPSVLPNAMPADAEAAWWHFFGLMQFEKLDEEIRLARNMLADDFTEQCQRRLTALREAQFNLWAIEHNDP